MLAQRGFFDLDARYAAVSAAGDPLEKPGGLIDFEIFRSALDRALKRSDGSTGGSPADGRGDAVQGAGVA